MTPWTQTPAAAMRHAIIREAYAQAVRDWPFATYPGPDEMAAAMVGTSVREVRLVLFGETDGEGIE
jgi:hypothetical protein